MVFERNEIKKEIMVLLKEMKRNEKKKRKNPDGKQVKDEKKVH